MAGKSLTKTRLIDGMTFTRVAVYSSREDAKKKADKLKKGKGKCLIRIIEKIVPDAKRQRKYFAVYRRWE